jgi:hypothetical protein
MKHSLKALAAAIMLGLGMTVRARTRDVSFTYRMGAGFPGDVNRTHPASILPGLMDVTNPVPFYGQPALINGAANSYKAFLAADIAVTTIAGVLVRPYPTQQTVGGMTSTLGVATPPVTGVVDVINAGFVMVQCSDFAAHPPVKGGAVYVWAAATAGNHVLGGFEASATGGSTATIANARFNGPPDANGVCELQVWAA